MPATRDLDRRAERLLRGLLADGARAARVTLVLIVVLASLVTAGLIALSRGTVCQVLDKEVGGTYCVATPTPTPSPSA